MSSERRWDHLLLWVPQPISPVPPWFGFLLLLYKWPQTSCLSTTQCIISQFRRSEVLKSRCWEGSVPSSLPCGPLHLHNSSIFKSLLISLCLPSAFVLHLLLWLWLFAAAAKSLQSCPTLCDPRDGSPPCSPVLGILQARTLEWVAISFSNAWKWKVKVKSLSVSNS